LGSPHLYQRFSELSRSITPANQADGFFALSKKRMFVWGYSTEPHAALGGERMI
jgi:hypothetical protein